MTTVILVTYNGMHWIRDCLNSVRSSSVPVHTIVVDNASTDATCTTIQTEYPEVKLIASAVNLGFGKANNLGIQEAIKHGAQSVFLLNQDAILHRETIEELQKISQRYPEFGILSPIHLNGGATDLDYGFRNYLFRDHQQTLLSDLMLRNPELPVYPFNFVNAALWFISKKCLEQVGGFHPYFFHYGEDREYVNRLQYHGLKLGVVPGVFARHNRIQQDSEFKQQQLAYTLFETQWLNPNESLTIPERISALRKNAWKEMLSGHWQKSKSIFERYRYFSARQKELITAREQILSRKPYLFLENV